MPDFQIDKSSGVGSSVIKVNPLEVNKGSTPKMAQLKVTISDGTTKTINLTQNTAQQSYKYFLIVDPTQVPVDPLGGTVEIYVESYREIYLNGQLQGTEKVGYTIRGESGITVNGNTITVGANGTPMDIVRRATVIQDTSGKQVTITIQQTAGQSESSYVFTADPMFVEFDAAGGSQAITITSSKSTMVNGQPPTTVELDYTATISPGFTWDGTRITATENTGTIKTGTLVLTQAESNQEIRIEITQAAGVTEYRFAIKLKSEPEELFRQSMNLNYSATDPETYQISVRTSKFVNGQGQLLGYTMRADASWIQVSNDSFTISANSSESSRSGTITFTQDESGNQCTINVFQQGVSVKEEYTFTILSNSVSIENVGGTVTPSVTSQKIVRRGDQEDIEQVGYSWDLGSLPDWITLDPLTEQFTIEENLDTTRGRTAILQATQEESSKRITLTITQAKAEYTFLLRHREEGSPTTATLEFNFNWDTSEKDHDGWYYRSRLNQDHMIGFSAKSNVDWITLSNFPVEDDTSPQPPNNPTFHVANNNSTSARTGTVTLTQNRSGKTCKIIVHQTGATSDTQYTFSGPASIEIEPEGGNVAMNIQSEKVVTVGDTPGSPTKVGYSLTSNSGSSWLTPNTNTNWMQVKENTEQEERSATLTFKQDESGKTLTIKITQKKKKLPNGFNWGTAVNASAPWFNFTQYSSFRIVQNNAAAPKFTVQVYSVDNGAPVEPSAKVLGMGVRSEEKASWKVDVTPNSTPGVWDITVNYIGDMSNIVSQGSETPVYRSNTYLLEIYQYESHWDDVHLRGDIYSMVGQGNHKRLARLIQFNESTMLLVGKVPQDLDGYALQIAYSPEDEPEIHAVILLREGSGNSASIVANYETIYWANIPNLSSYQGNYALKHCVENNIHIVFDKVTAYNFSDVVNVTLQPNTSFIEFVPPDKGGLLEVMLPANQNIVTFTQD